MEAHQVISTTIELEPSLGDRAKALSAPALLYLQTGLVLLGMLALLAIDSQRNAMSYFLGSGLVELNLVLLLWTFSRILQKKLVALAVSIIVFKYAFFGAIIYKILRQPSLSSAWFCVGLGTILVTVVCYPLVVKLQAKIVNQHTQKD